MTIKHVAPHITDRKIELMWISIRQKDQRPIYVGTYYGKQESRSSKEETEREMNLLQEEIMEMSHEGEARSTRRNPKQNWKTP